MKFLIISHTLHKKQGKRYFAYGPYVREMNLWEKQVNEVYVVAPLINRPLETIDLPYQSNALKFYKVPVFSFTSFQALLKSVFTIPYTLIAIWNAMHKADHIHLRCPGNMGLLGCLVQMGFPKKKKTAKYAGNWDPDARQPLSYRFQKWILNNSFLTRNMQVMVYGHWPKTSKNIVPFFTASYPESKKEPIEKNFTAPFKALFVGGLTPGKDALYAVQLIHLLAQQEVDIRLDIYGEGTQRKAIEYYIDKYQLEDNIYLKGNQPADEVEQAYKKSHFLILASKSEGWPKAVAEAMFWGCIPLATSVSCVPEMLGQGRWGVQLSKQLDKDLVAFLALLNEPGTMKTMSSCAQSWSQPYTLEAFEKKIINLLSPQVEELPNEVKPKTSNK